jgi:plasmid rolling circle replication initiator protein Rep
MIEPQLAPGPEGPIQSADRSTATVVGVDQSFSKTWFEADPSCSVTEMKKIMMANVKGSGAWLPTRVLQKSGTHSTK